MPHYKSAMTLLTPHLVEYNDEKEHLTVNYIDVIAYLVGAVKELSAKLE